MLNIFKTAVKTEIKTGNYQYLRLKFCKIREEGDTREYNAMGPVMITNMDSGYSWETTQYFAALLIMSAFKNIERNERVFNVFSEENGPAGQDNLEGYFPVDQMVFQQLRCLPDNMDMPQYEIHNDQRARIPITVGNKTLWLAILNEDDMNKVNKHKRRKGDLLVQFDAAS